MRHVLSILFIILANHAVFGCLSASQNRLFPLGVTSAGLCVFETRLTRTEYMDEGNRAYEMNPGWLGVSFYKIYDKNHKEVYAEALDTFKLFGQDQYAKVLGPSFEKALLLAKKNQDYLAAKPVSLMFCDYQVAYGKTSLIFDTLQNKVMVEISNKTRSDVFVLFDSTSIASNVFEYLRPHLDEYTASAIQHRLYLNSIRQFQLGDKKLTIVHIGAGQTMELANGDFYPPGKAYKAKFPFKELSESIFTEQVLHHGHGFDFYIWE